MSSSNKLVTLFISLAVLAGALILFIPVQHYLILFIAFILFLFLLYKPLYCYYLVIFTIPFTERIRILPISFSPNDILILVCVISVFLRLVFQNREVSLKTSIDKWNIALLILYFFAGITSIGETGILTSFKFLEAVLMFYVTVYLIRSKKTFWSRIIKAFLFTALFQATIGILQSTTGGFGAQSYSQRGYLGYLGIGPTAVWHAWGTFGGNGMLPDFLVVIMLLLIPFLKVISSKKRIIILAILSLALYMGYSKESLLSIFVCSLAYYYYKSKRKRTAALRIGAIAGVTAVIASVMAHTDFVKTVDDTLSGRLFIWSYPLYVLANNARYLWIGAGLNSYWTIIDPILPQNILAKEHHNMLAHNYFLLSVQEMGIIGTTVLFSFFIAMGKKFMENIKRYKGYYRNLNISAFLFVITIFTSSLFGQFYYLTFSKELIYILFGIFLAKENYLNKSIEKSKINV